MGQLKEFYGLEGSSFILRSRIHGSEITDENWFDLLGKAYSENMPLYVEIVDK